MKRVIISKMFVYERHEDFGSNGWREKDKPHFQPLEGMAVAHDTLEHFPDDSREIEHELMALGAMLWVRGPHYGRHAAWENIQASMTDVYPLHRWQDVPFGAPLPGMRRRLSHDPCSIEGDFHELNETLFEFIRENCHNGEDLKPNEVDFLKIFVDRVVPWLRHGYRRARRRYCGDGRPGYPGDLSSLFQKIQERADKLLKRCDFIGQEMTVDVNTRFYEAKVELVEEQYDNEDEE